MTITARYQQDLERNRWQSDDAQRRAVQALDELRRELLEPSEHPTFWSRLFGEKVAQPIRGLYLWGGVGRGKTYLMDLFYSELGDIPRRRQHFHRFMLDVHAQLNTLKEVNDPLARVAKRIHSTARVICFDEFFVADIADAMILGRLFEKLFELGTVLVATSNVPPDDLYKGGLQRSQFLPAIEALKHHTAILEVDGGEDYRLSVLKRSNTYLFPHTENAVGVLHTSFEQLAPDSGSQGTTLALQGREIETVRRADGIVWFTFDAICNGPRGAADYIEIARSFQTVFISQIPVLDSNSDDQARRFITLVDEFYDRRVKLLVSADIELDALYQGKRLAFEFERTRSRMIEMQGTEYLAQPHIP
ncbi:MAG: cell division protein ZapE [Gammaproteobacteria bacterium]